MNEKNISVTWRDREIKSPVLRTCIVVVAIPIAAGAIALAMILMAIGLLIFVASMFVVVPLHFLLVACRRRGFLTRSGDNLSFSVSRDGFRPSKETP